MSDATANGILVLGGEVKVPRVGAWRATLDLDTEDSKTVTGAVDIAIGSSVWSGTSFDVDVYSGRTKVVLVGGKGGLRKPTKPRFYHAMPARQIVQDLLDEGGERLAPSSSITQTFDFWTRSAGTVAEGLEHIVDELGAVWRMLPDGTIWIGTETWSSSEPKGIVVIAELPDDASILFASDEPTLLPGTTFRGKHVEEVEIRIEPGSVRTRAWFEKAGGRGGGDALRSHLASLVRQETHHVDLYAIRSAKVASQNGDGSLEITLDDPSLPGMSKVPIAYGIPGITAEVLAGARVHVGFEGGSPAKPYAVVVDGSKLKSITVKASQKIVLDCNDIESQKGGRPLARLGDMVRVISTPPGTPAVGQIITANKKHRG